VGSWLLFRAPLPVQDCPVWSWRAAVCFAGGDAGRKPLELSCSAAQASSRHGNVWEGGACSAFSPAVRLLSQDAYASCGPDTASTFSGHIGLTCWQLESRTVTVIATAVKTQRTCHPQCVFPCIGRSASGCHQGLGKTARGFVCCKRRAWTRARVASVLGGFLRPCCSAGGGLWPMTSHTAQQHHTCSWGHSRHRRPTERARRAWKGPGELHVTTRSLGTTDYSLGYCGSHEPTQF
jgi:hypothetical protein